MGNTRYILYAIVFLVIYSCVSSNSSRLPYFNPEKGFYTSSFPTKDVSPQLTRIQQSVLRITSTSIYTTYFFGDDINLTVEMLKEKDINKMQLRKSTIDQSKAGTAISILQNDRYTALVTAAHVLDAPDTLISYKQGVNIPQNKYISSVGIKLKQRNYLHTFNNLLEIDVMAVNPFDDLALIRVRNGENDFQAPPLRMKTGAAMKLQFGSFIYVIGYPLGSAMVTRGIVSAPNYDNQGNFLTDALFNHGISGGLIVASRDNFNSLEWVGMSITASASEQYFLVPDPTKKQQYRNLETYADTAFITRKNIINYGVTQATPIEKVLRFLYSNEDKLNRMGLSSTDISGQQ
ncbi:MAG: trypsin-like peptidase domain-containing protein [Balneolaceae bacterium]|nr:trypsin-like peptidase domain-containing protein [Balneolaceae bacterium]